MYTNLSEFHHACLNILDNQDEKLLNYAVNYASYGMLISDKHEAKVQALYILNNIKSWRGPIATETRSIFKNVVKYFD